MGIQDGTQAFGVLHWNDDTRGAAGLGERQAHSLGERQAHMSLEHVSYILSSTALY